MTSIDANILLYAYVENCSEHQAAKKYLTNIKESKEVAISEFVLTEFYRLIRNPVVMKKGCLDGKEATKVIQHYRNHPKWRILGFNTNSAGIHDKLWEIAARDSFAFRQIYDARIARSLLDHGVKRFATRNVSDFLEFGFGEVFDPLLG